VTAATAEAQTAAAVSAAHAAAAKAASGGGAAPAGQGKPDRGSLPWGLQDGAISCRSSVSRTLVAAVCCC
jgi:hypothetical protein